jgi:hypothetical protein
MIFQVNDALALVKLSEETEAQHCLVCSDDSSVYHFACSGLPCRLSNVNYDS